MKRILYIGNDFTAKSKYNSTMTTLSNLLSKEGFQVIRSSRKKPKLIRLVSMCLAVLKYRNVDYMLIDTFSTSSFYFAFFTSQLARLLRIDYIPILHGGALPNRLKHSPRMSQMVFKNSKINIAPSNYLKEAFEKKNYEVLFIPNTIEISTYAYENRSTIEPKLLWVRAFDKIYNPQMAIEVLRGLQKEFPKAQLCMVGPTKDNSLELCTSLVNNYALEDFVEFTGVLPRDKWCERSVEFSIFINTTNFDNTPVSVLEAMALGLPVVSTNVGGIPFLIQENEGVLVDKGNTVQMISAIKGLINNPKKAQIISEAARAKVEKFDWSYVKTSWLKILA